MKIVINAFSARVGGGVTYLRNILSHLPDKEDIEIYIFCHDHIKLPDDARITRVETSWPTENPLLRAMWERIMLPRFLAEKNIDVLFCPGGVVVTSVPKGVKIVTMFRNMLPFDKNIVRNMPIGLAKMRNKLLRKVMLSSMANADLTIFISDYARQFIQSLIEIPNPITIPHGISSDFRRSSKILKRPDAAPDGSYILYVSRFDVYKHHQEVVKAFSLLPEQVKSKYKVVFLGETDWPEAKPVMALIKELGLDKSVLMLGAASYESLPSWYQNSVLTLFASSCENCPNILLEAMAAGRPIISSDVMPMPEFGGLGLRYFSPFCPESIARAMEEVLISPDTASQVGKAAEEQSKGYDWSLTAAKTWKAIIDIGVN